MTRYCVSLVKTTPAAGCCGARIDVRTGPLGTETRIEHDRWCRVGRLLRWPALQTIPGWEPQPVNDSRTSKEPRR